MIRTWIFLAVATVAGAQTNAPGRAPQFKPYIPPAPVAVAASEPKEIQITKVVGVNPPYTICETSEGKVYVVGLPPQLKADLERAAQLATFVSQEKPALKAAWKQLKAEQAAAPSTAAMGTPAGNYIRQLNMRMNQLEEREDTLAERTAEREEITARLKQTTRVQAKDTGRKFGSAAIWAVTPIQAR
jgi:hypothetical protein